MTIDIPIKKNQGVTTNINSLFIKVTTKSCKRPLNAKVDTSAILVGNRLLSGEKI
jgi:hypothetical protein